MGDVLLQGALMKKYVFIDFDGTLMQHQTGLIPTTSIEALKTLKANGHVPIIATGKNLFLLEDFPARLGVDHVIGSNGAFVYSMGELIQANPMDADELALLIEKLQNAQIDYTFSRHDLYITHQMFGPDIREFSKLFNMQEPVVDPSFNQYSQVYQLNIFTQDDLDPTWIEASSFHFLRASFNGYDVIQDVRYKESGIAYLKEKWHLEDDQIMAIGDGLNDVGMIQFAHTGIAMGNAQKEAKDVADYVTDRVENDGLAKALKHFRLI